MSRSEGRGSLQRAGCSLAYRCVGAGKPVVFVQGVGIHGDGWLPQIDVLAARYRCASFDNRGMGASQPLGAARLTVAAMVDDVLAVADASGMDAFHVVGHSMGGHVATALALAAPRRVRSLALMCTSARGKDMPPPSLALLWTSLRTRIGTREARRRAFLEIVLPRAMRAAGDLDDWARRLAPLFGHDLADTPAVALAQIRAYRGHDATPRLAELAAIPTLVVSAAEDPLSPPELGRRLAEGIPGARWECVEDASHGVTITHAREVTERLADHFASAAARQGRGPTT